MYELCCVITNIGELNHSLSWNLLYYQEDTTIHRWRWEEMTLECFIQTWHGARVDIRKHNTGNGTNHEEISCEMDCTASKQ